MAFLASSLRRSSAQFVTPMLARTLYSAPRVASTRSVQALWQSPTSMLRPWAVRHAASSVAGRPASESIGEAGHNAAHEAKQVVQSLEEAISGANTARPEDSVSADAKSLTGTLVGAVPKPALTWGLLGVVPYAITSLTNVYLARQEGIAYATSGASGMDMETAHALLLHTQNIQVTFGAVLLSFLGAIHWGFEMGKFGGEMGNRRYLFGLAPLALSWPTLFLAPQMALAAQWALFVGTWFGDLKATSAGWTPRWYSTYRFYLTSLVGGSIILTLAGTNYYSPTEGVGSSLASAHRLQNSGKSQIDRAADTIKHGAEGGAGVPISGKVPGQVRTTTDATSAGYVMVGNPERERKAEEERKAKEKKEQEEKSKDKKDAKAEDKGKK